MKNNYKIIVMVRPPHLLVVMHNNNKKDRKVFIDNAVKKSQIQATCSANPDDTRHLQEEKS